MLDRKEKLSPCQVKPGAKKMDEVKNLGPDNPSMHSMAEPPEKERHYESGDGRVKPASVRP
jgi:hypothetical protein